MSIFVVNGLQYQTTAVTDPYTPLGISGIVETPAGGILDIPSSITIENIGTIPVTFISENAFANNTAITEVVIPNSITEIRSRAFLLCSNITSVYFPQFNSSLITMGETVFGGCTSLTSIIYPKSMTVIPVETFNGCTGLRNISLPNGLTSIGTFSFSGCSSLNNLSLPSSLLEIKEAAFQFCSNLTNITIYGDNAFTTESNAFDTGSNKTVVCKSGTDRTDILNATYINFINYADYFVTSNTDEITRIVYNGITDYSSIITSPIKTESLIQHILMNAPNTFGGLTAQMIYVDPTFIAIHTGNTDFIEILAKNNNNAPINIVVQHPILYTPDYDSIFDLSDTSYDWYVLIETQQMARIGSLGIEHRIYKTGNTTYSVGGVTKNTGDTITLGNRYVYFGSMVIYGNYTPPIDGNICFNENAIVGTDQGNIQIKNIDPNIHTIRKNKILALVKTKHTENYVYCIRKNTLGQNIPDKDTIVSGGHGIYLNPKSNVLTLAKHIPQSQKVKYNGNIMYNVLMKKHDKMIVNNMIVETLDPSNPIVKLL